MGVDHIVEAGLVTDGVGVSGSRRRDRCFDGGGGEEGGFVGWVFGGEWET